MTYRDIIGSMKDGQCARRPTWRDYIARVDEKDGDGICTGAYELRFVRNGAVVATFQMEDEDAKYAYDSHIEQMAAAAAEAQESDTGNVGGGGGEAGGAKQASKADSKQTPAKDSCSVRLSKSLMLAFIADDWRIERTADVEAQQKTEGSNF